MIGMANPEIPDFDGGWWAITAVVLVVALLLALRLTDRSDSQGDKS